MLLAMPSDEGPAHTTVEVGFDTTDYVRACDTFGGAFGGGDKVLDQWRALGDFLADRTAWRFHITYGGYAMWSLGAFGASLVNIHVKDDGRFYCLDSIEDKLSPADNTHAWLETTSLQEVEAWLADREAQYRKPSATQMQTFAEEDWRVLRRHVFCVRVTWSDGWYLANVRGLPEETTFEKTLQAVIGSSKAMITRSVQAPPELTAELRVRVEIDDAAAKQFTEG